MIPTPHETRRTAHSLLEADRRRAKVSGEHNRLVAAALGFVNLFFCAYWERFLADDPHGTALTLYFTIQSFLFCILAVSSFWTGSSQIVHRTHIFPVTAAGTFLFVIGAFLRRPAVVALIVTNALFLIINYKASVPVAFASIPFVLLIPIFCSVIVAAGMLFLSVRASALPGVGLLVMAGFAIFLVMTVAYGGESLLGAIPPGGWAAHGILAAAKEDWPGTLLYGTLLLGCTAAGSLAGVGVLQKR